jgi:hypothetical protein
VEGGSSLGYKHTESTKEMLSELAKKRKHSDETKTSISESVSGEYNFFGKIHSKDSILKIIEGKSAHPVYIYNSKKNFTDYLSFG